MIMFSLFLLMLYENVLFQGDSFCGREDDHMPDDCAALIDELVPAVIPVLGADLAEHAVELCTDVGAC
jgi:hypothetical protein